MDRVTSTASSWQGLLDWIPAVPLPYPCTAELSPPYVIYMPVRREIPVSQPADEVVPIEEAELAHVYAEFTEEDGELAETGLGSYVRLLHEEEADYEAG